MSDTTTSSGPTTARNSANHSAAARLYRLRRRLTLILTTFAAVGLSILALVATIVDSQLRNNEADTYRQGLASRLAAIIYPDDETGAWVVDGVVDDMATEAADAVLVATRSGEILYVSGGEISRYELALAAGLTDTDEAGTAGSMEVNGESVAAAAAPFWDFDTVEGAVVVAFKNTSDAGHQRLRLLVWSTVIGLTALSGAAAWIAAGRIVRPMGESLDREERFLATAAHQIRTPLGRIRASAESAARTADGLDNTETKTELRRELHQLITVSSEAADSANDLLLAGRIDANQLQLRREQLRLDQLVAEFESVFPNLAVASFEPVTVRGDAALIRHAVVNLLNNAIQHGRAGNQALLIEAEVFTQTGFGVVQVSDNGPGFGRIDTTQIFERHVEGSSGSGLGLWIAKTIVEEHGGSATAFNRHNTAPTENQGATVELQLPLI